MCTRHICVYRFGILLHTTRQGSLQMIFTPWPRKHKLQKQILTSLVKTSYCFIWLFRIRLRCKRLHVLSLQKTALVSSGTKTLQLTCYSIYSIRNRTWQPVGLLCDHHMASSRFLLFRFWLSVKICRLLSFWRTARGILYLPLRAEECTVIWSNA